MRNHARQQYPVNSQQQQHQQHQQQSWQSTGSRKIRYHDVPSYTIEPSQMNYTSSMNNNFGTANGIKKISMDATREDFRIQKVGNYLNE